MLLKLKSCFSTVVLVLAFMSTSAQQFLNYQAIAWDASRIPKANSTVTVQIAIRSGSINNTPEYTETFTERTNEVGYFNIQIGSSQQTLFKAIDWSKRPKFLEVKVDDVFIENSEMPTVPYALYAEQVNLKAGSGISIQGNEISNTQKLELSNDTLKLVPGGNAIALPEDTVGFYKSIAPIYVGPSTILGTVIVTSSTPVGHLPILSIPISQSNKGPYLILANVKTEGTYYLSVTNKAGTRTQLSSFFVPSGGTVQNWQMASVQAGDTVMLGTNITQSDIPQSGKINRLLITAQLGIVKLF